MGHHEADGAPKKTLGRWNANLVLKRPCVIDLGWKVKLALMTCCHWLGCSAKLAVMRQVSLLSLARVQSNTGGNEASKQGWWKSYIQLGLGVPTRQVGTNDLLLNGAEGIVTRQDMTWGLGNCDIFVTKFEKHGANEHHRVIYKLWQSQAVLFVIMLWRSKTTQIIGHPRYAATAMSRLIYMWLVPMLYGHSNLPVQK
jgi:hypothetical protein